MTGMPRQAPTLEVPPNLACFAFWEAHGGAILIAAPSWWQARRIAVRELRCATPEHLGFVETERPAKAHVVARWRGSAASNPPTLELVEERAP